MTVSVVQVRQQYNGNGVTTIFPIPFPCLNEQFIKVYLTYTLANPVTSELLEIGTDYTAQLFGATAQVTLIEAPATGVRITIQREVTYTQPSDLLTNGVYSPQAVEDTFDYVVFQIQQLLDAYARAIKLPPTAPVNVSSELPNPEALKFLQWNPTATALRNTQLFEVGEGGSVVIPDGSIQTDQLADKAITVPKLNDDVIDLIKELGYEQATLNNEWNEDRAYKAGEESISGGTLYEALEDVPANESNPQINVRWYPSQTSVSSKYMEFNLSSTIENRLERRYGGVIKLIGSYTTVTLPLTVSQVSPKQRAFFTLVNSRSSNVSVIPKNSISPLQSDKIRWLEAGKVKHTDTDGTLVLPPGASISLYEAVLGEWFGVIQATQKIPSTAPIVTTDTYLINVTFINDTGRAFMFFAGAGQGSLQNANIFVDGVGMAGASLNASAWTIALTAVVPAGSSFIFQADSSAGYESKIQYLESL